MNPMNKNAATTILVVFFTLVPLVSFSDSGPEARILSVHQDGQDVVIQLGIGLTMAYACSHEQHYTCSLERVRGEQVHAVFENQAFSPNAAMDSQSECYGFLEPLYCEDHPEFCADCNGDGSKECMNNSMLPDAGDFCYEEFIFQIVDECVDPGPAIYFFIDNDYMFGLMDTDYIEVENSGDVCLDAGTDVDTDTDLDGDADGDSDLDADIDTTLDGGSTNEEAGEDGCGVVAFEPCNLSLWALFLLLLV